jgi:hypothetical protein
MMHKNNIQKTVPLKPLNRERNSPKISNMQWSNGNAMQRNTWNVGQSKWVLLNSIFQQFFFGKGPHCGDRVPHASSNGAECILKSVLFFVEITIKKVHN